MAVSPAQADARAKCIELLGEHFTAFILVTENETGDDNEQEYHTARDGGYATTLGLLQIGIKRMTERPAVRDDPEE